MVEPTAEVTGDVILQNAVPKVADVITLGWTSITGEKTARPREKMEGIAKHLLETKKLKIDDKEYNLAELPNDVRSQLIKEGVDLNGLDAFADKDKRQKLAAAVDKGVKDADNWFGKITDFLGGLMDWLAGMMSGQKIGFWEAVGERASKRVSASVNQSVAAAVEKDPSLKPFVPYMGEVQNGVHQAVMSKATGLSPEERGVPARAAVEPMPINSAETKNYVSQKVDRGLNEALNSKDANGINPVDEQLSSLLSGSFQDKRVSEVKEAVRSFTKEALLDPTKVSLGKKSAADMTPEEFKQSLKTELTKKFERINITNNDGNPITLTKWYQDNWVSTMGGKASRTADWALGYLGRESNNLPSDAAKVPEYLASKTIDRLTTDQLEEMKLAREVAEKDFKISLKEHLDKLENGTPSATEKARNVASTVKNSNVVMSEDQSAPEGAALNHIASKQKNASTGVA